MKFLRLIILSCLLLSIISTNQVAAFDIWGIEIQARQIGLLEVDAEIIVYVRQTPITDSFRDSLQLSWGDQTVSNLALTDNDGDGLPDGIVLDENFIKYTYRGQHTYNNLGRYLLSVTEPNREAGLLNLNFPNSVSISLYTEAEILLMEDFVDNQLPVFLEPPINYAFVGQPYLHVPNAFTVADLELVYELVVPKQDIGEPVPNYYGIGTLATVDSETGIFSALIEQAGAYAFAIQVTAYRNGEVIHRVVRDMKFEVEQTPNSNSWPEITVNIPPLIFQEVNVGDTVRFATEINDDNTVQPTLSSSSGLYDFYAPEANYTVAGNTATFEWIVLEEQVRMQPYFVVIKAKDDDQNLGYNNFTLIRYRVSDGTTSTKDNKVAQSLSVYPNPASSTFTVSINSEWSENERLDYRLFAIDGQLLKAGVLTNQQSVIRVESLPNGSYLLEVSSGKLLLATERVLIVR